MIINRITCSKCGLLFAYAPNSEGTTPTRCVHCDPDNEYAVSQADAEVVEIAAAVAERFVNLLPQPASGGCSDR